MEGHGDTAGGDSGNMGMGDMGTRGRGVGGTQGSGDMAWGGRGDVAWGNPAAGTRWWGGGVPWSGVAVPGAEGGHPWVQVLGDEQAREMCLRFADMECKLGEVDRARAIYTYCSQICDPRVSTPWAPNGAGGTRWGAGGTLGDKMAPTGAGGHLLRLSPSATHVPKGTRCH